MNWSASREKKNPILLTSGLAHGVASSSQIKPASTRSKPKLTQEAKDAEQLKARDVGTFFLVPIAHDTPTDPAAAEVEAEAEAAADVVVVGWMVCPDETMGPGTGHQDPSGVKGPPNVMHLPRKPKPFGLEYLGGKKKK